MKTNFTETQKFTQWWLWALLIAISAVIIYSHLGNPSRPINSTSFIISISVSIVLMVLFLLLKLQTTVNEQGVSYSYFPFIKKRNFTWQEIESAKVINYGFVGGWGIRTNTKYGTVYNVKDKMGMQITLQNGKKFVIGTQKYQELIEVLEHYQSKA